MRFNLDRELEMKLCVHYFLDSLCLAYSLRILIRQRPGGQAARLVASKNDVVEAELNFGQARCGGPFASPRH